MTCKQKAHTFHKAKCAIR